jgi:hypothetical protein
LRARARAEKSGIPSRSGPALSGLGDAGGDVYDMSESASDVSESDGR